MPRDQKIGYTLLILMIGFAGAFCFRKPVAEDPHVPALKNELDINQQIAVLRSRPFLPAHSEDVMDQDHSDIRDSLPGWYDEGMSRERDVPAPIGQILPMETVDRNRVPEPRDVAPLMTAALDPPPETTMRTSGPVKHLVEPGETLSGIAYRYFGAASKYLDVFEANRDQLSSPNALRPGMVLTIPELSAPAQEPVPQQAERSSSRENPFLQDSRDWMTR